MEEYNLRIESVSPPDNLPVYREGEDWSNMSLLGKTKYADGMSKRSDTFGIKRPDRRQHMYVVGKTGVGKSKLIELLARTDISLGHCICVIDPHGDLINDLADFIPENRIKDVVMIDLTDMDYPVSFNPVGNIPIDMRYLVTSGLIESFKKQFGTQWTSRLEHVCRFTILALLDYQKATMADAMRLLTDPKFRQKIIPHIQDDVIRRFWALEFASWSEQFNNEAITPLVNRIGQFLSNPLIRHCLEQQENKINFDDFINSNKIILINLSKGIIGEENTELFGTLVVTSIYQAAMRRAKIPQDQRTELYLYVDEFQNIATRTFLNLLSESRKYGLNITLSHQYLGQISPDMINTVFGNVGTILSFRLGGEDAERLTKEFAPVCKINDLLDLNLREFVIKMMIDGSVSNPFLAQTLAVTPSAKSFKKEIYEHSRKNYSKPLAEAKAAIAEDNQTDEPEDYSAPIV